MQQDKPLNIEPARLHWGEDGLPRSALYGDIYFAGSGLAETEHVFLAGNALAERWRRPGLRRFVIGECGFGSGLNFLCAWRLWQHNAPPGATLHYISCEKHPLAADDLARLHTLWPELAPWSAALRARYVDHSAGLHRLRLGEPEHPVLLDLCYGEAAEQLEELAAVNGPCVDAWFLDGFAPAANPAMWSSRLFHALAALSRPDCSLATYSVAASVRQGLSEAGFRLSKTPGYGRKRHMLRGHWPADQTPPPAAHRLAPWHQLPAESTAPPRAIVIGAGLAGCATAWALAQQGLAVSLIERHREVAQEASGNPQGALYLKLNLGSGIEARFMRQAWLHARRHYEDLAASAGPAFGWHPCGLLQMAQTGEEQEKLERLVSERSYPESLLQAVDAAEASRLAGVELERGGLWLPGGAWLDPAALCRRYLARPGIELVPQREALRLEATAGAWRVFGKGDKGGTGDELLAEAPVVVLANGLEALEFAPCRHYPLQAVRGQLSYYAASDYSQQLGIILCGKGYLMPAQDGRHSLGASFVPDDRDTSLRERDHQRNRAMLAALSPRLEAELAQAPPLGGRAAIRCVSPDHLPLAGPVEDRSQVIDTFAALRHHARRQFNEPGRLLPGLYINVAHGSHGITQTPLIADYLAALISGAPAPLSAELVEALHPARCVIRQLKRREI